ncbi:hypothetical protein KI688_008798 [Linnemannia hyalina]|uniref:F-box domain-containing protein n=1 Tax=Linnemannia hyalina TaxID=64524 RepID=A0A9P7Y1Y3_9FUNG|nr:hypothetical protein KI688_008798 [Linnemannia hyalina]
MQTLPPEVLLQIGLYLNAKTSLTCMTVCREWRMAFTPSLCRVVNSCERLWRSILHSIPFGELPSLFSKHNQWIRDLNMDDVAILNAALKANLTTLQSLTFSNVDLNQTMAVWAFVLSDPGLQQLAFNSVLPVDKFAITITTTSYPLRLVYNLTRASESFLISTFSTLTKIRHLHIGMYADDYLHTLSTLVAKDLSAIETARVRFPNIRTVCIKAGNVENPTAMFQQLSTIFPAMECLGARRVYWWEKKVTKMPFLVRLEVGLISPTDLNAISSTYSNALVYLRFSLRDNWSAEVCQILAACARLRECLGDGHVVLAEDIINGPTWTSRIETRFTRRTAAGKEAQDHQKALHAMQQQVYANLAQLRNLVKINFGWSYTYDNIRYDRNKWATKLIDKLHRSDIETGIDFSQESGFGQVVSLPSLKKIKLRKFCETQAIGSSQQSWMMEGWEMRETWKEHIYTLVAHRRA